VDGQCDVCGKFAYHEGKYLNDLWQPDYWNGPRITFYCPTCYKKEVRKRDKY
jgi:hypothetical protein